MNRSALVFDPRKRWRNGYAKMRLGVLIYAPPRAEDVASSQQGHSPRHEMLNILARLGGTLIHAKPHRQTRSFAGRLVAILDVVRNLLGSREKFDVLYATSEDLALVSAYALWLLRWPGRIVFVAHRMTPAKLALLHPVSKLVGAVVCVSRSQQRIIINAGFAETTVHYTPNWVDTHYFTPAEPLGDFIFSCGLENRDYMTLFRAAALVDMPITVAASGFFGSQSNQLEQPPSTIKVLEERVSWDELRRLYAQSRFVVLPLNAVEYAAGVTGLVEAMAMGKAVIATQSPGIEEYVDDGRTGLIVPPGDPAALAHAISRLWRNPDLCKAMGERNRMWAVKHAEIEIYTGRIAEIAGSFSVRRDQIEKTGARVR